MVSLLLCIIRDGLMGEGVLAVLKHSPFSVLLIIIEIRYNCWYGFLVGRGCGRVGILRYTDYTGFP